MKALTAIIVQTVRSAVRSRVFHVLFALILLAVFGLPLTVTGDGTASGQLQITLTYSLGAIVALVSTATIWLACSQLPREIEDYSIHMVTTKPCPRWVIWLGKWLGVFAMQALIFIVGGIIVLVFVLYNFVWSFGPAEKRFAANELSRLRDEVLVGRRPFHFIRPDFDAAVENEYARQKAEGLLADGHNPSFVREEILRKVRTEASEIAGGTAKTWIFTNVNLADPKGKVYLRYRHYAGSTSQSSQKEMKGVWHLRDPAQSTSEQSAFLSMQQQVLTGTFQEIPIDGRFIDRERDNAVVVAYENVLDTELPAEKQGETVIFQLDDGPVLLVKETTFWNNYLRSMVLGVLQLAFLAALGCTVGAAFSTPVAAFTAVAYLVIGLSVQAAVNAPLQDDFGKFVYKNGLERAAHYMARTVRVAVVSVDDFDATSDLARGRLIEISRLGKAFLFLIVLRGGIMGGLGIAILHRRELGAVIRR